MQSTENFSQVGLFPLLDLIRSENISGSWKACRNRVKVGRYPKCKTVRCVMSKKASEPTKTEAAK